MRTTITAIGICLSTMAAGQVAKLPASHNQTLPVFSFMGETTTSPTTRTELNGEQCSVEGDALKCAAYLHAKVAGVEMGFLTMNFNKGLLYSVTGSFYDRDYDTVLRAFTEKYGEGKKTSEKWQAKSGSIFDNSVTTWDFDGGQLKINSMGLSVGKSLFVFASTKNAPPADKPKIDF